MKLQTGSKRARGSAPPAGALTKRSLWSRIKRDKYLYMLLLPGLLFFIIFCYVPMYGIVLAFKEYDPGLGIMGSPWVGLRYFERIFKGSMIWKVIGNTLRISFAKIVIGFPMPVIFALLLNEIRHVKFKKTVQTITYLPHFLSWVVVAGLVTQLFSPSYGLYGYLAEFFGFQPQVLLAQKWPFFWTLIVSDIWKGIGYGSIIYLAAISGIPQELYEAAKIDGAGRFRQAVSITLPSIMPTVCIMFILRMGSVLSANFDQVFTLYNPAVYDSAEILDTYVYSLGLEQFEYSLSTAVGLAKNVVQFGLVMLTNWVVGKFSDSTIW